MCVQVLGGSMMGQSPVAQGFMQSLQSPFSSSLGYSTPLGPLSPFPGPQPMPVSAELKQVGCTRHLRWLLSY